eukprot:Skav223689  [mRNA]  locus=scaffold1907:112067:113819:+ [translate_table: standard]
MPIDVHRCPSQAIVQPCASLAPWQHIQSCCQVYGITRVSRRPELVGLGFYGIAGALVATTATQVTMWGLGPLVSFSILAMHSDRVQRRSGELSLEKEQQTSLMPFLAFLDGRQSWVTLKEELVTSNLVAAGLLAFFLSAGGAVRPSWMAFGKTTL